MRLAPGNEAGNRDVEGEKAFSLVGCNGRGALFRLRAPRLMSVGSGRRTASRDQVQAAQQKGPAVAGERTLTRGSRRCARPSAHHMVAGVSKINLTIGLLNYTHQSIFSPEVATVTIEEIQRALTGMLVLQDSQIKSLTTLRDTIEIMQKAADQRARANDEKISALTESVGHYVQSAASFIKGSEASRQRLDDQVSALTRSVDRYVEASEASRQRLEANTERLDRAIELLIRSITSRGNGNGHTT